MTTSTPFDWSAIPFADLEESSRAEQRTIGASNAPGIMGASPYSSPSSEWLKIVGLDSFQGNERTEFGQEIEPFILEKGKKRLIEEGTSVVEIKQNRVSFQSKEREWQTATPDAFGSYLNGDKEEGFPCEAKWTGERFLQDLKQGCPQHYWVQVQHQLCVFPEATFAILFVLCGYELFVFKIEPDEEFQKLIIEKEQSFYEQHVKTEIPPLDESWSKEGLSLLFPERISNTIPLDPSASHMIERYETAKEDEKDAKGRKEHAQCELIKMLGDNEAGELGDWVVSYKQNRKGSRIFNLRSGSIKNV